MSTLVKDTHRLIAFLQTKGYTAQQAEGFVEAVRDFDVEELAKKADTDLLNFKLNFVLGLLIALVSAAAIQFLFGS